MALGTLTTATDDTDPTPVFLEVADTEIGVVAIDDSVELGIDGAAGAAAFVNLTAADARRIAAVLSAAADDASQFLAANRN